MPTYSYECEPCAIEFDAVRKVDDRQFTDCPQCGFECEKVFTPNGNIHIPSYFGMSRGWHLPERGVETGVLNPTIRPIKRKSFKETVEKNLKGVT